MPERTRQERLEEFQRRLAAAKAVASEIDALKQIADTLNGVEDDMTSIPSNPATRGDDGRMYPPQSDARRPTGCADVARYRTRGHNILIRANGAIEIRTVKGDRLEFEKPGEDGRKVSDP
jgi:hypothetical protein